MQADEPFADGNIDRPTPCLVVDDDALSHNVATMAAALPGPRLRPHVKAFKSTALARRLVGVGHHNFSCATLSEVEGMLAEGLGHDLLMANQTLDAAYLRRVVSSMGHGDRFTLAVDSPETIDVAAEAGVPDVLIDVNVGLPRCGCHPADASALADLARSRGLNVRGVMGYEGHLMMVEGRDERADRVAASMADLVRASVEVGGEIISAGGTGTYDMNHVATEIQAGSYTLMDTHYGTLGLPFRQALWVEATIISVNEPGGWIVADAGLKAFGMDHGNPTWPFGDVWFCSDEHTTLGPAGDRTWRVGDRVRLAPAHVDPTVAKHERMWLVTSNQTGGQERSDRSVTEWPVDLRHW